MIPAFFLAHGAPLLAIEQHEYVDFLNGLGNSLPKPKAILLFSAHWESMTQLVSGTEKHEMIYDFYGFPDALYQMVYPAQGDPKLAVEVQQQFEAAGVACQIDPARGLDHGAWVLLHHLYPQADVPVLALSVNRMLPASEQYNIGKALAALRAQNVLIIGSGGTVHNLRRVGWEAEVPDDWALQFDDWLKVQLEQWNLDALFDYRNQAPFAREAVPTPEHFIPLLLAMGAADDARQAKLLHRSYQYGSLSLCGWQFG